MSFFMANDYWATHTLSGLLAGASIYCWGLLFAAATFAARLYQKGYRLGWTALCLLNIIGWLIVAFLPDRRLHEPRGFPVTPSTADPK